MAEFYDELKRLSEKINTEVPIEDVLALHGIYPNAKGWYSLRPEDDTPSAHIDKEKRYGNTIHDFGAENNTFGCCSFTAWYRGISYKEATILLAENFGYEVPIAGKKEKTDIISNWEWEQINIQPDMASKNMDHYPEKYGTERTMEYADKYRMSMNELKKEDIKVYERIIRSRAIPHVLEMRNQYYRDIYSEFSLSTAVDSSLSNDIIIKNNADGFNQTVVELAKIENILQTAIKDTTIKFKPLRHKVEVDFHKVVNGEISFEIGNESYYNIKCAAFQDKVKVFYCLVNLDEYYKLMDNGLDNIHVAAFQKGDQVNLAFSATDSSRVNFLIRALRGKELDVGKTLSQGDAVEKDRLDNDVVATNSDNSSLPFKYAGEKEAPFNIS